MSICCGEHYTFYTSAEGSQNNIKGLGFSKIFFFDVLKDWTFINIGCFDSYSPVSFLGRIYFQYL